MKKLLLILLTIFSTPISADEIINTNMEIKIYERFIDAKNYEYLGSMSIWMYNSDYNSALVQSLNSTTPIETITIIK